MLHTAKRSGKKKKKLGAKTSTEMKRDLATARLEELAASFSHNRPPKF